ncbi:aspartic peptidase A1 [Athelia psychrophila]|uniref:Aspartic peptidase A1 n=1 Tax=Athelia psychrophila TaxID=1759441 RepID=A0A166DLJ1_9AGAM|nr:aspartic peptidase A1 [Fibularhizoctonia sp. CBS 109695]
MLPVKSLLALLTLAVSFAGVSAGPVLTSSKLATLPFKRSLNLSSFLDIVKADQARAKALKSTSGGANKRAVISSPATNTGIQYIASVGVGSPATNYDLIIDTGSSNTWIGANTAYTPTSTSQQTPDTVSVSYGFGSFSGTEYIDQVTIASGLVISKQSIGVASTSTGLKGLDGILGIGPTDLTIGTLSPDTKAAIPTVTDNLFTTGTITDHTIGISFEPITSDTNQVNGELSFGGTDSSKYTGAITYVPITATSPSNTYWGIDQSITYGDAGPSILSTTAGIVDTGTTLLMLATDAFKAYTSATGGVFDQTTGLLQLTPDQYSNLQSLFFSIGGSTFELTANAQIFPRSLNSGFGGSAGHIYLIAADIGTSSGSGLDFINGYTFLERFYSEYDTANQRVGLATTPFTTATSN